MNRIISTERVYPLGDFKNIKIGDTITDIPEEFAVDKAFISQLRYLQLIETEIIYRKYHQLNSLLSSIPSQEEAIALLEDMRTKSFEELMKLTKKE